MQNYRRPFFSAVLTAFLFISSLSPLNTKPAYACPAPPPPTLLQLYLGSELTVVADVTSEETLTKESGSEYGEWATIKKNVQVVTVYKGVPPADLSFTRSEYFSRVKDEAGSATGAEERSNALLPGNRYLIFLRKDKDSGEYELAPNFYAFRRIEAADEKLYDRRLTELASILKATKDQLPALTEWLVRLIEEPKTLYDGTADISNSFYRLNSQDEETEDGEEKEPFLLSNYSSINSPHIAETLAESQKNRISAVLERQLQEALANQDEDSEASIDSDLVSLVSNWDLEQMTMRVNAMIQNSDPADAKRIEILMSFINYAFYDDELSSLSYRYRDVAASEDPEDEDVSDENGEEASATMETEPEPQPNMEGTEAAPQLDTTGIDLTETARQADPAPQAGTDETETVVKTETAEPKNQVEAVEEPVFDPEAIKLKRAKLMTKLVRKFNDRYQYLLARGFKTEDEDETEEAAEAETAKPIITTN